jgi:serine phosphatase RsbU (regulator of sigma subunit)
VIEAKNAQGELFGWQRLEETIRSGDSDVEAVKVRVGRSISGFVQDHPQSDDTTVVLIGVEGE